MYKQHSGF